MSNTTEIQHLVCGCNQTWDSILPAPPCPYHTAQVYNGLCYCRGAFDPHPFHTGSPGITFTTTARLTLHPAPCVGKCEPEGQP